MSADLTRVALAEAVERQWEYRRITPVPASRGAILAQVAVAEVISALRSNPAWARSLGIGGD